MDDDRKRPCAAVAVPDGLSAAVAGYRWARDTVGQSGGAVYRLHGRRGAPDLFLKHGQGPIADDVTDEMVRLRWLARHVPVPAVTGFFATAAEAWLLMSAVPGHTAWQTLAVAGAEARLAVTDALAAFLRRFHAIPVADCPFSADHADRLARARERMAAGLVAEDEFDEARAGWTAGQVWDAMQRLLPIAPDPVVTHGDASLDNILLHDGVVAGCIDVGRVGIADRYQDVAILWNGLGEFGSDLQDRFLSRYGIADLDADKLRFHLLLDEMF